MRIRASVAIALAALVLTVSGDAGAQGSRAISVDNVDTLRLADTYDLGAAALYYRFTVDGRALYAKLHLASDEARILRLNLQSGRIRWAIDLRCPQEEAVVATRVIVYSTQCFGEDLPRQTAANPANGRTMWTAAADGFVGGANVGVLYRMPELGQGDEVGPARVWGVRASTGRRLWTYRSSHPSGRFLYPKLATRDTVYVYDDGDVVALDMRTGRVSWRLDDPADGDLQIWDANERGPYVFRSRGDRYWLMALDADTGGLRWQVAAPTSELASGDEVFMLVGDRLQARSADDGSLLWEGPPGYGFTALNGILFTVEYDGPPTVVAYDAATGRRLAEYPSSFDRIYDTVISDERILMPSGGGTLQVYEPSR